MGSKFSLKNGQSELSIIHRDGQPAKTIYTDGLTNAVDTVADMEALITSAATSAYDGNVCFVKDLDRGGSFIYDSTKVSEDNQGTNFNGWIRQYDGALNVKWFGAKGDYWLSDGTINSNKTNNYSIIQHIIDCQDSEATGLSIYVPKGGFYVSQPIEIKRKSTTIYSNGMSEYRNSQYISISGILVSETDCILLDNNNECNNFEVKDITLQSVNSNGYGISFIISDPTKFIRNFQFNKCYFNYTKAAINYSRIINTGVTEIGNLKMLYCRVEHSKAIITQNTNNPINWNKVEIRGNDISGNVDGGITLEGYNIFIGSNIIESSLNTINIKGGGYEGHTIIDNYFEDARGDYIININKVNGTPTIRNNNFRTSQQTTTRLVSSYNILDTDIIASGHGNVYNNLITDINNNLDKADKYSFFYPIHLINRHTDETNLPQTITFLDTNINSNGSIPNIIGFGKSSHILGFEFTTDGSSLGNIGSGKNNANISAGKWVCISNIIKKTKLKHLSDCVLVDADGNSVNSDNMENSSIHEDEYYLSITILKALKDVKDIYAYQYPTGYSVASETGIKCKWTKPAIYVFDNLNDFIPLLDLRQFDFMGDAPTKGEWHIGDTYSAYYKGDGDVERQWVCINSGTPGDWVPYGIMNNKTNKIIILDDADNALSINGKSIYIPNIATSADDVGTGQLYSDSGTIKIK